jgi:hypothetical protein
MDQNAERPQSEARPARRRRAERKKETSPSSDFIYALASTEPGENGLPQLTKKLADEPEAVLEAHLTRVPYYRLQKCIVSVEKENGSIKLIGVPA